MRRNDINPRNTAAIYEVFVSMKKRPYTQREIALTLLSMQGILRLIELRQAGVTAATMRRLEQADDVVRLSRGVYQLFDADWEANHNLAVAAKQVPKGVVCLLSALAFHGLTDLLLSKVWMAIGPKDWAPQEGGISTRIVRFADRFLSEEVETHEIEGVPVKIFGAAKTVVDCFRHRNKIGPSIAIEGLREILRQGKATPAEIDRQAERGGVSTVIDPYLEAIVGGG